jgi:tRNA 2-(methylsulfanyl)-N6-isopentenyladenosine37 hydroxylase
VIVVPSAESWVRAALTDLPTLLVDHAHCEKKAASTAVRFLFKYPEWTRLNQAMSKLAREELLHFDRVLGVMRARGVEHRALPSGGYASELFAHARAGVQRRCDEMLVCALIEARSHERFERLAAALANAQNDEDRRLGAFYEELGEAEARHGSLYVELAEEAAGGDVGARLAELAAAEAEIVARPGQPLRMHAGG